MSKIDLLDIKIVKKKNKYQAFLKYYKNPVFMKYRVSQHNMPIVAKTKETVQTLLANNINIICDCLECNNPLEIPS